MRILRPDWEEAKVVVAAPLAVRGPRREQYTLGLIDNGKHRSGEFLSYIADELKLRLPISEVLVHQKPSAGKPVDPETARDMAARAHLVITGVGS
jgi:hypothetical protein